MEDKFSTAAESSTLGGNINTRATKHTDADGLINFHITVTVTNIVKENLGDFLFNTAAMNDVSKIDYC